MTWRETEAGYWEAESGSRWMAVLKVGTRFAYLTGGHGSGYVNELGAAKAACEATVGLRKRRTEMVMREDNSGARIAVNR